MSVASGYRSPSQVARIVTEHWVEANLFCPVCGCFHLEHYKPNRPVADFFCRSCGRDFELKSKNSIGLSRKIVDGEYSKMIARITSENNPHFLFLTHHDRQVGNCIFIPGYFFTPDIIERRKPLGPAARRAGWTGCSILLSSIPESGKIYLVKSGREVPKSEVLANYRQVESLKTLPVENRGWLLNVMSCIDRIPERSFSLERVYAFKDELALLHPTNRHIEAKIRQQLQILRDRGFLSFTGRGHYTRLR